MHECPQCWQVCYCDLDDSNDCRENGVCYHQCQPEDDESLYDAPPFETPDGKET